MSNIEGLIYGAVIGDILGAPYQKKEFKEEYTVHPADVIMRIDIPWSSLFDRLCINIELITNLRNRDSCVNVYELSFALSEWKRFGIEELPIKNLYMSMNLNYILNNKEFVNNPLLTSKTSYIMLGGGLATNDTIVPNSIYAITQNWTLNSILSTSVINYDCRCIVGSLLHNYILNCLCNGIRINWKYIGPLCKKIINSSVRNGSTTNKYELEFTKFWHYGMNYEKYVLDNCETAVPLPEDDCNIEISIIDEMDKLTSKLTNDNNMMEESAFLKYLKKHEIGKGEYRDYGQDYVLIGMMLSIITVIDLNVSCADGMNKTEYFKRRLREVASLGGESISNCSIVGSIIGAYIGKSNLPPDWVDVIGDKKWLDNKIKKLIASLQN